MNVPRNTLRHTLGLMLREAGESLDRVGCWLQGSLAFKEKLNRSRRIMNFKNAIPGIGKDVFVAPSATVIGNVTLGDNSSVWYNVVIRGDVRKITIGSNTNIQDRTIVHVTGKPDFEQDTVVGNNVTVETGAILHGCIIKDNVYIGIGASVLDGAVVESGSIIAPGSVVVPGSKIPSGQLWAGTPAKFVRNLTAEEQASIAKTAQEMKELADVHREECGKQLEQVLREIEETEAREEKLKQYRYTPAEKQ